MVTQHREREREKGERGREKGERERKERGRGKGERERKERGRERERVFIYAGVFCSLPHRGARFSGFPD